MLALVILGILCMSLFSFFVFMIMFYDWRWIKNRHRYAQLPTPKWHFIVGAGLDIIRCKNEELFDYLEKKKREVKSDLILAPVLGRTNVMLFAPDDIEELFKSFEYVTKGYEYFLLKPWYRNNVTLKNGQDWLKRRKLLTPAYHNVVLQNYLCGFNKHAKLLTQVLADHSRLKGYLNIEDYVIKSTLDSTMETMLGVELNCLLEETPEYVTAIKRAGDLVLKRGLTFWMHNDTLFNMSPTGRDFHRAIKQIHNFCIQVINERKQFHINNEMHGSKQSEGTAKSRKLFLDYLLALQCQNPSDLPDDDLIDEIQTVLLAGNESVALALIYTIFMMATNPEAQERLQQEIDDIFGKSDRDVTVEDLNQLNFMEMVISESLRLYPVFPIISRFLETDLKLKKYTIPAGTNIMIVPYTIHRNPDLFPDPEKFDPDRFLPEAIQERHKYAFLSWSAGYRNCMGKKLAVWQMKVVLTTVFRSLTVRTNMKREDLKVTPELELKPTTPIYVTCTPRLTSI